MTLGKYGRNMAHKRYPRCPSCDARLKFGDPATSSTWPLRIHLEQRQIDVMLAAALEFDQMHREFVEMAERRGDEKPATPTAVDFIDWLTPDALREDGLRLFVHDHDGAGNEEPVPYVTLRQAFGR